MKKVDYNYLDNYKDDDYIWYACYGSNINTDRLMIYINGDALGKLGRKEGCRVKMRPKVSKPYILNAPIYFAGHSKKWNCGMAFLDYENEGKSYGRIYKLQVSQFKDILKQENELYDAIIYVDNYDDLPVFTFTAHKKLENLERPSKEYCDVIKEGILNIYSNVSCEEVDRYLQN